MKFEELKQGVAALLDSVSEGWQHLRQHASSALTRFRPERVEDVPTRAEVDDHFYMPSLGWSMLGGDVFEDESRIVIRLEIPGMNKSELDVEVEDDVLIVRGEKRFERESSEGRYRVLQCAYGKFRRAVPLPCPVRSDEAVAAYRDGVLRITLPKAQPQAMRRRSVLVN